MDSQPDSQPEDAEEEFGLSGELAVLERSRVADMKQVLINERAAPELLRYEEGLVQLLESLVAKQEEAIADLAQIQGAESELTRAVFTQEANRVKFLLRAYLRCRLLKVERFVMHILDSDEEQEKLSTKEMHYVQAYFKLFGRHMRSSVLKHLPPEFEKITKQSNASTVKDMIPLPDLDTHVFCRVLEDVGNVELDDQGVEATEFWQGDLYVVRYRVVQHMLQQGQVQLV